jgi:hypothetical protein
MPVYDPKTGKKKPRRVFRGCMSMCKGFKGRIGDKSKPFGKCVSQCISYAQTGQKRGMGLIPKAKNVQPCSEDCPKPKRACLENCFRRKMKRPRTRERAGEYDELR